MDAITKDTVICPNCGQVITEILEHFSGDEVWKNINGKFVRIPDKTIESYSIIDKNCGGTIPEKMAGKLISLMSDKP